MSDTLINRCSRAFRKSQHLLDELCINAFPIDVFKLVDKVGNYHGAPILVSTLGDYNEFRHVFLKKPPIHVKDGCTIFDPYKNIYLIIYNEDRLFERIRFTILHELAHILLGHLDDADMELDRGPVSREKHYVLENEADTFSGNILVPPILIRAILGKCKYERHIAEIQQLFQVSKLCAESRGRDYDAWLKNTPLEVERKIYERCCLGIDSWSCSRCHAQFEQPNARCCVICGNSELSKLRITGAVVYGKVRIGKSKEVFMCPRCGNEFFASNICTTCGAPVVGLHIDDYLNRLMSGDDFAPLGKTRRGKMSYVTINSGNEEDGEKLPF